MHRWYRLAALFSVAGLSVAPALPAYGFEVKKPEVHEGEVEVEYHGASFAEHPADAEENLRHSHEIGVSAGLTRYWKLGIAGELEKEGDEDFDLAEVEITNTLLLKPDTGDGIAAALFAGFGTEIGEAASAIEIGPIFQIRSGQFSLLTNTFLPHEFNTEDGDFWSFEYAVQAKYAIDATWGLGLEAYGEVENLGDAPSLDDQAHRLGPVLYWSSDTEHGHNHEARHSLNDVPDAETHGPVLNTAFGVLFGLTDATNDITLKWDVEMEF